MGLACRFVFLVVATFAANTFAQTQNQGGFISLDCGFTPKDANYTEKQTGITYVSDSDYIGSGESREVKRQYQRLFDQPTWFLRSFREGKRNCYVLEVEEKQIYLIRATFLYGNYDNLSTLPTFDLYLGTDKWVTITLEGVAKRKAVELVHTVASDDFEVCLVKTGSTTPFISSLELRPLGTNTYDTQSGSLLTVSRSTLTSNSTNIIRFNEDTRDRLWTPFFITTWTEIKTAEAIGTSGTGYDIPELAMKTAAVPTDRNESLTFSWETVDITARYYVFMHYAEIENLRSNESREFSILFNGDKKYGPFRPPKLSLFTISTGTPFFSPNGSYQFSLVQTENSTHPPLLNAIEVYQSIKFTSLETRQTEVSAMKNIKRTYKVSRISWQGDPCIPQEYRWEGLNCSYEPSSTPKIKSLNMSAIGLTGKITPQISKLTLLQNLDLSDNRLTGEVPEFLATMSSMSFLDLSGNNLSGNIPSKLNDRVKDGSLKLVLSGNPNLCSFDSCKKEHNSDDKGRKGLLIPIASSVASLVVIITILATYFYIRKKKKSKAEAPSSSRAAHSESKMNDQPSNLPFMKKERKYSYEDVKRMTKNFQKVLGKGGFGVVYLGHVNNEPVAVKMLSQSTTQGYKQFKTEVEVLLRVHHRNLASLVGYHAQGNSFALIYEFMANGDLHEHLSGKRGTNKLNWASRLRIAAEAAQGLEYLHSGCRPPIVHRDVKTSNILLSENFQAKVADFGLSRSFATEGATHVSTAVAGTMGYLDPEYFYNGRLTEKSDVFSFGVVLLEIITNRKVIDNTRERPHIVEWTKHMLNGWSGMKEIVDQAMENDSNINAAWKVVEVALACADPTSTRRPTMSHVVMVLNECLDM